MYVCMHGCMCVCMCMCMVDVCTCVCTCVRMYVCMYVCLYVYMYVCMYICMNVWQSSKNVHTHTCMYVCLHVYRHIRIPLGVPDDPGILEFVRWAAARERGSDAWERGSVAACAAICRERGSNGSSATFVGAARVCRCVVCGVWCVSINIRSHIAKHKRVVRALFAKDLCKRVYLSRPLPYFNNPHYSGLIQWARGNCALRRRAPRALLRKMTITDKASYGSSPPSRHE